MTDAKYVTDQEQCRARFEEELDGLSPARLLLKLYDVAIVSCDDHKREQIRRAAEAYVMSRRAQGVATRFDVIAITGAGRGRRLELIKDAF